MIIIYNFIKYKIFYIIFHMKFIYKIKHRISQFKEHPLISYPSFRIVKYIYINIKLRYFKKQIIVKWLNDLKYHLSIGDSSMIGNYYFILNDYTESIFLLYYLNPLDTFIDIGSNHGHYTLLASGIIGNSTISIEPVKDTFSRLKSNIEINKLNNITLLNIGLSNTVGELRISNNKGSMNKILKNQTNNNFETIKVTTLDKISENIHNLSIIKIDVEGYEKYILEGGFKTLKNKNLMVIIIELNEYTNYYDYNEMDIIEILKKFQFKPYRFLTKTKELIELKSKNDDSFNTIFIRDIDKVREKINNKSISFQNYKGCQIKVLRTI